MLCSECPNNEKCNRCLELIQGSKLRKKVNPPIKVELTTPEDGKKYTGRLIAISRLGMLIETSAPFNSYTVTINGNTKVNLTPVLHKGLKGMIAFDISKIDRDGIKDDRLSKEEYELFFSQTRHIIDKLTENLDENVREEIRKELQTQLAKSELLDRLLVGSSYRYEKGHLQLLSGKADSIIREDDMIQMMKNAIKTKEPVREMYIDYDNDRYIDLHALPLSFQSGGFLSLDVSEIVKKERELRREQWENYRDIILFLTNGKIILVELEEFDNIIKDFYKIDEVYVADEKQLPQVRKFIKEKTEAQGLTPHFKMILSVTEAVTNAIKHAKESCMVEVWVKNTEIIALIKDEGQGIQTKILPKATLIPGFSTKHSLGKGFHVMINSSDKIYLKSDRAGTIVGLLFQL